MQKKSIVAIGLLLSCGLASAGGVGGGLQVGTTGFGTDVGYQFTESLGGRVAYSAFSYSKSTSTSDINYDGTLKASSLRVLADYELGFGFRLTGGLAYIDNKVDVTGKANNGYYNINGSVYPSAAIGSLSGHVKLGNGIAPYVGVGYGMIAKKGLGLYVDIGAMYEGKASATLNGTCGSTLDASTCAVLKSNIAAEQQRLQDKLNGYSWYPVVSAGVSYAF
jgi:hypothetical protein